jgi:hypothetical protein
MYCLDMSENNIVKSSFSGCPKGPLTAFYSTIMPFGMNDHYVMWIDLSSGRFLYVALICHN